MRIIVLTALIIFTLTGVTFAQRPSRGAIPKPTPVSSDSKLSEALAIKDDELRLAGLLEFLKQFPKDPLAFKARESVVSARAAIADRKLIDGDSESALNLFNEAISDAPEPISDELFAKVLLQIPTNLFVAGKRNEAFDAANEIEKKISSDARKLIGLTTFFITVQYGTEAIRLAEKAIAVDPNSTLARFTLATALRLNFRLSDAIGVYRQILELDEASVSAKLNLADLLRATGDLEKSISYYREILEIDGDDPTALAGLAISLYLKGDEAAPSVLERATIADPSNGIMHATIAFHQMKSGETFKALDSADRAIAASPTSSWGYIAKARAMRLSGDFDESERLLIFARSLGDFPSLNYELASIRFELGYFREAAETIFRAYDLDDGLVISYLGNRVLADAESFSDLIALERRAVVLDSMSDPDPIIESRLKSLMFFVKAISSESPDISAVLRHGRDFVEGDDAMRLHREIFIAGRMLQRNIAVEESLAILRSAVPRVDDALKNPLSAPATLADDIYEARQAAFSRNQRIFTPRATLQVLGSVLRGRLEELTGFALLRNGDTKQAIVRFRRALSVLPEKSAWWNSAQWRLGNALEADGNKTDAVEAYIKTYDPANPDVSKYSEIERVWVSLERSPRTLIERIGEKPSASGSAESTATNAETTTKSTRSGLPEDVPFIVVEEPTIKVAETVTPTIVQPVSSETKEVETAPIIEVETPKKGDEVGTAKTEDSGEKEEANTIEPAVDVKKNESPFGSIVISTQKKESDDSTKSATTCRLIASPSLINVSVDGSPTLIGVSSFGGDHREITARTNSTADIEVIADESANDDGFKKIFKSRSISAKAGVFKITFTSPCGSREVEIRVK